LSDGKSHNTFLSILVRAVVLALLYPILKSVWEGWSTLAGKFSGQGIIPYLSSALVFFVTFFLLSWVLGTAPVRWFKKGIAKLWRYLVLKRFFALENGEHGKGWEGKEVAYAERGRFGARERPQAWSLGVVMADFGKSIAVLLVAPPGGTSRLLFLEKDGGLIWPTGRPVKKHIEALVTFGNGVNPEEFLPERGHP
jgi:hypothetical protein